MKINETDNQTNSSDDNSKPERKPWHAPKLVIEDTENTRGGNFACNSPGDDAWYSS